jgi:predicted RNA-binding protein YlxR (DUF448 family)
VRVAGALEPDPDGRRPGRGAYLCRNKPACAERAIARRAFQRSFRGPVAIPDNLLD